MTIATENPDELLEILGTTIQNRNEPNFALANAISTGLALSGLVGFWPISSIQRSTGNAYDLSSQGRTLTYNGNPTYNWAGLVPYIDFDGTGDYLSRADETDLDIIGTETQYANPGLTFGGWFYPTAATVAGMFGKSNDFQGPYMLINNAGATAIFRIRDSTDVFTFDVSISISLNAWQFITGRFTPSTETKIWNNSTTNVNVAGIPAAILNGTDNFSIGALGTGNNPFTGRASMCFLCASALSDSIIQNFFQQTRTLYSV